MNFLKQRLSHSQPTMPGTGHNPDDAVAGSLIVSDPEIMGGTPVIRGTRITAAAILGRIDGGDSVESVLEDYPYLDRDKVAAAVLYARANPPGARPGRGHWRRAS